MNEALIYIAAAGFLISVFPIHVFNYIYINTEEKYASINVTVFRFLKIYNINTVKNKPNEMQINGKNKNVDIDIIKTNFYKFFNKLCIQKVVQLTDFGLQKDSNAYAAIIQNGMTTAVYSFLKINGNSSKLKNYVIMNEEHSSIRYYAKAVTIINILVLTKILLTFLTEKIYALKN